MKPEHSILTVDPGAPQPAVIQQAADAISQGHIIAFPTTSLYGLGADALNPDAVKKIFDLKQRDPGKPVLVLVKDRAALAPLVTAIPETAVPVMENFWPGQVTLVFNASKMVPPVLTAGTGKIGIRMPLHKVAQALVQASAHPITGTSANVSGDKGYARLSDFSAQIKNRLRLVLDAGPLRGGIGSTVVDVTTDPPRILRQGDVPAEDIFCVLPSKRMNV